ncbi:MAG: hypothetical protein PHV68_00730 [Candidatus Gastranaerophilales bacterium]|nr:hypothetical protein [Candidatus Gastranaerophilales bacterium]
MNLLSVFKDILKELTLGDGISVVFLSLFAWLGKLYLDKNINSIKKDNQKEIDGHKNQLEILKSITLSYSGKQFDIYLTLWSSLIDLKNATEDLWNAASDANVRALAKKLKNGSSEINKGYLLIEEEHYRELIGLLEELKNYQIGKKKLVSYYQRKQNENEYINNEDIQCLIQRNEENKKRIEELIDIIGREMKRRMRGEIF